MGTVQDSCPETVVKFRARVPDKFFRHSASAGAIVDYCSAAWFGAVRAPGPRSIGDGLVRNRILVLCGPGGVPVLRLPRLAPCLGETSSPAAQTPTARAALCLVHRG